MDGKVRFLVKLLFPINVSKNQILVFPFLKTGHCIFKRVVPINWVGEGGGLEDKLKEIETGLL